MLKLTDKESRVLQSFVRQSIECCGCFGPCGNMSSISSIGAIEQVTGFTPSQIGGVLSALIKKQLVFNDGPAYGSLDIEFLASESPDVLEYAVANGWGIMSGDGSGNLIECSVKTY